MAGLGRPGEGVVVSESGAGEVENVFHRWLAVRLR